MTVRPTFTGPAAVPDNLVATVSPATTAQSTPGGQVLTASATGGTGAVSWAWVATYSDGSSADGLLSGSGSTRTLTTTTPGQVVSVVATGTDSGGANVQVASASAVVSVAQPALPTLSGPARQTQTYVGAASVTFTGATGYGALSYSASLSKPSGSSATLSGSGLGAYTFNTDAIGAYTVTLTLTDSLGRTAQATGIVSTEVVGSVWSLTADVDATALTPVSLSATGTFAAGSLTGTFTRGSGNTGSGGIDASGLFCTIATGTANAQTVVAVPIDKEKKSLIMWKMSIPSLTGTTASARLCLSDSASVTSGTQLLPLMIKNNASAGLYDFTSSSRLTGTGQGATTILTGVSSPGTAIIAVQMEGRQTYCAGFDADTFPTPDQLNTDQWFPIKVLGKADTTGDDYDLWLGMLSSTLYVGVEIGVAAGTMRTQAFRVYESNVVMG